VLHEQLARAAQAAPVQHQRPVDAHAARRQPDQREPHRHVAEPGGSLDDRPRPFGHGDAGQSPDPRGLGGRLRDRGDVRAVGRAHEPLVRLVQGGAHVHGDEQGPDRDGDHQRGQRGLKRPR
jgi:hypothetical protein